VQHDVVGSAILAADQHMAHRPVQVPVITYDRRLTGAMAAVIAGAAALRRLKWVDLNAAHYSRATVIEGVMVHVARNVDGVAFPDRVLLAVADQRPASLQWCTLRAPRGVYDGDWSFQAGSHGSSRCR
jgi:hypothetical protein